MRDHRHHYCRQLNFDQAFKYLRVIDAGDVEHQRGHFGKKDSWPITMWFENHLCENCIEKRRLIYNEHLRGSVARQLCERRKHIGDQLSLILILPARQQNEEYLGPNIQHSEFHDFVCEQRTFDHERTNHAVYAHQYRVSDLVLGLGVISQVENGQQLTFSFEFFNEELEEDVTFLVV
jgi:hypothetical protein